MKQRILFVHDLLDFRSGGAVLVIHNLLAAMDRDRFDLELATPQNPITGASRIPDNFLELGVPIHSLPTFTQTSDRSFRGILATLWELLVLQIAMFTLILRRKPDFVYVHSVTSLHFTTLPALLTRTPLVYHEHGLQSVRSSSLWDRAFPWLIRRARHVICIAHVIAEEVVAGGVASERVSSVPNGLAPSEVEPRLPATNEPPSRFAVIQIANLLPWKGHATLIRAAEIARTSISGLQVHLFGRAHNRELADELHALTRECGVSDVVEFCGYSENLEAKLPEFDCLVLASDSEPFGLVLLEAMRAGVPVIATRAGGVPEIVRHGHDGLLFDPGDHETLARHLIRLAGDRAVARELAEHGLETLEERFSVAAQARGVAAVFASLAQTLAR
ncbi:MAG: glycosyltransferase family 4 protein [bacterium]|nr:glycosyltransferase family 4 protein [bacterium]